MTQMDLFQTVTSSQQDTPVSLSVLPGSAEAQKMTDTSGLSFLPLLKQSDPLFAFSKMFLGMSLWASTKCYLTWKGKATQQGRSLFQLVPRTHLTEETDSGSSVEMWATPNTMDHLPQRSQEALEKQANTTRKGRARPSNLREQVNPETVEAWEKAQEPNMWATPRASDMKEGRTDAEREGPENKQEQRLGVRGKPSGSGQDVAYAQSMHSDGSGEYTQQSEGQVSELGERSSEINVAHTDSEGSQGQWREHEPISRQETGHAASYSDKEIRARKNWQPEPRVGRVAHGISNRVDRLRGLGNAIVPQISMRIGLTIKETM